MTSPIVASAAISVQDLVASQNGRIMIPEKYIRPELETDEVTSFDDNFDIPIIDFARLLDYPGCEQELAKLKHACEDWGFFQLKNHGIPEEVIDKMKADIAEFFKLPLDTKRAYAIESKSTEGYGQHFIVSELQKLDWADMMYIVTQPQFSRNMKFWPTEPTTFRNTLDKYSCSVQQVATCLLGAMGRNLGLDTEIFLKEFRDQKQAVRINYYPPCPEAKKVIGLSPHTDACGLTMLLQANEVQGLQIKRFDKWIPIKVPPDSLVVNIGTALEVLSNGKYKSIEHRAVIDPKRERLSIAAFTYPTGIIGPLSELSKNGSEKYKSMTFEDYMNVFLANKLDGRSFSESLKLD